MKKTIDTPEQYQDVEVLYLISLIKSSIRGTQPLPAPEKLNWQRLYNIAKRHMVTAMVYPCIKSTGGCPAELLEKWKQKADMALIKELQYDAEREAIFEEFDKNGIDYLPLKGIIIKDFYPRKGMRQFGDNDILYKESDEQKVREIMLSLGYTSEGFKSVHDVYSKKPFYLFEMHRHIFNTDFFLYEYFNDVWGRAVKNDGGCGYHMTERDFYISFLAHFYKHYIKQGGCGLRFFVDLYVIKHKLSSAISTETTDVLKEIGLYKFEKEFSNISESFFGDENIEIDNSTLKYIIESGAYGTIIHKTDYMIGEQMKKEGKLISSLKMAFPSLKEMQLRYKVLKNVPILLPIFYVVRWFSILFTGEKRAKLKIAIKRFFKRK